MDINWRSDSITRRFIKAHPELTGNLTKIKASDLGNAATYCKDWNNPFIMELLRRSGHLEIWKAERLHKKKREILDRSCRYHGFRLM